MEKFVKTLSAKKDVSALLIDGRLYIRGGQDVGHIVALPLKGQHKGQCLFGDTAYQPLQYNEAFKPFSTDNDGDSYYLFYNFVDRDSTHVCVVTTGEILPVVRVSDLMFSSDLQAYLRVKLGADFEGVHLAHVTLQFLSRFEGWRDAWACITRQQHAPYGVDRQVTAIHDGLFTYIGRRRCGFGVSASDWTTRVFPAFRAVLREWQKTQWVEDYILHD